MMQHDEVGDGEKGNKLRMSPNPAAYYCNTCEMIAIDPNLKYWINGGERNDLLQGDSKIY